MLTVERERERETEMRKREISTGSVAPSGSATPSSYAVSRFSKLAEDETLVVEFGKLAQLEILSGKLD